MKLINKMFKRSWMRKKQALPIFIISFNRKWQLERSLASYRQLGDIKIIIHDNGSDDPETISYLEELESSGVTVNRYTKIKEQSELNKVNESINKYFSNNNKTNYIVTDPDIELLPGSGRTLQVYNCILDKFPDVESVGPMLKIDDIPREFPLYNNVLNRHIEQFWRRQPKVTFCSKEEIALLRCKIDTTFAMHRAGQDFKRLTNGIRLYGQHSARHLDWYKVPSGKDQYFNNSNPGIAHWSNKTFHEEFKNDKLKFNKYYDIETRDGKVEIIERRLKNDL